MSAFSNFAIAFSIISILAGCITSYRIALVSGGALTLGWLIVGLMVLAVALAMAEICSRYPTAGGLYFWAGRLAKTNKRQWAWLVGPTSPRSPERVPLRPARHRDDLAGLGQADVHAGRSGRAHDQGPRPGPRRALR